MNVDDNTLVTAEHLRTLTPEIQAKYTPVPGQLSRAAKRLLGASDYVHVPRSSQNPVAKWAAEKRRNRRKMIRASRKANRPK